MFLGLTMKTLLFSLLIIFFNTAANAMTCKDLFTLAHFKQRPPATLNTQGPFNEIIDTLNSRIKILDTLVSSADKKVILSSEKNLKEDFTTKINVLNEALNLLIAYKNRIEQTHKLYSDLAYTKQRRGQEIFNSTLKSYVLTKNSLLFPEVARGLSDRHNISIELYRQVDLILNSSDYLATSFNGLSKIADMVSSSITGLNPLNQRNSLKASDLATIDRVINEFISYKEVLQHMVFKNYTSVKTAHDKLLSSHTEAKKIINYAENKKDRIIQTKLNNYLQTRNKFPYIDSVTSEKLITDLKAFEREDLKIVSEILSYGVTPSHLINSNFRLGLLSEKAQEVFIFELPHRTYIDHKKNIEDPLMFFWTQTNTIRFPKINGPTSIEQTTAAMFRKLGINENNFWMYYDLVSAEAQYYFLHIAKKQLEQIEALESL